MIKPMVKGGWVGMDGVGCVRVALVRRPRARTTWAFGLSWVVGRPESICTPAPAARGALLPLALDDAGIYDAGQSSVTLSGTMEAQVKRIIAGLVVALIAPLLFAAGGTDTDVGVPATLRIGSEGYYLPFNYIDESGELKGFDIDIALALCEQMEVECKFVAQDWDGIIPALLAKKYDAIVASMSITEERNQVVSFTDRVLQQSGALRGRQGEGFDPGYLFGRNVGAQRATVAASWLEENAGAARVKLYDTQETVFLDLTAGRLDAVFADGLMLYEWLQTDAGAGFHAGGDAYSLDEGIGIAVRQEDEELRRCLREDAATATAQRRAGGHPRRWHLRQDQRQVLPLQNLLGAAGAVGRGIVYLPRDALRNGRQVSVLRRRGG